MFGHTGQAAVSENVWKRPKVGDAKVSMQHMVAYIPSESERETVTTLAMKRFGRSHPAIGTASELIDQAFPTRATALSRWLGNADGSRLAFRGLAMIDPLSRHRAWLHPTKLDGRRVEAPYADYADFMRRLEARRRR